MSTSGREAIGVFEHKDALRATVKELVRLDFQPQDTSIVAGRNALERFTPLPDLIGAADACGPLGIRTRMGEVVASGGLLASAMGEHARRHGPDALFDAIAVVMSLRGAGYLAEALDGGCLLLCLRLHEAEEEKSACRVLLHYSRHTVFVNDIPSSI